MFYVVPNVTVLSQAITEDARPVALICSMDPVLTRLFFLGVFYQQLKSAFQKPLGHGPWQPAVGVPA